MIENRTHPHDGEIEDAVIGAILLEPVCLIRVTGILRPECFYKTSNAEIFRAILKLDKDHNTIDILTVTQELKRTGKLERAGGAYEVSVKTNRIGSSANVERHALITYQYFVLRELSRLGMKLHNLSYEPNADALELLAIIQRDLSSIDYIGKNSFQKVGDVVIQVLDDNKKAIEAGAKFGIKSGFQNIDKFHVKQKQDFGVIAARPGMGKTAYMLAMAKNTAIEQKKPVAIFSLEMSTEKLVGRLMASESRVSSKDINQKHLDRPRLMTLGGGISKLLDAEIYIDDTPGLDVSLLRSKIRRMVADYAIEEVYIDYLQLMAGEKKGNREQEISYISRNLKMIAKEEDIPITALSQLVREVEKRNDKRPMLSDLRESGAIEQDADWVWFLFRPEYYDLADEHSGLYTGETFNGKHLPASNLLMVDCAKYREGALFHAALKFYGDYMLVENYDFEPLAQMEIDQLKPIQTNKNFLNENPLD